MKNKSKLFLCLYILSAILVLLALFIGNLLFSIISASLFLICSVLSFVFSEKRSFYSNSGISKNSDKNARANFLSAMTHELRTPLNGVIGMTELLSDTDLNIIQKDFLETISASSDTLLSIINDILDLSNIHAKNFNLVFNRTSIEKLFDELFRQFYQNSIGKDLSLSVYCDHSVPASVLHDEERLKQILFCLVRNIIKIANSGGIDICARALSKKENKAKILITIIVDKVGIKPEIIKPDLFSQDNITTSGGIGGLEIGLNLCRKILELMGSKLLLEDNKSEGLKLSFSLECDIVCDASDIDFHDKRIGLIGKDPKRLSIFKESIEAKNGIADESLDINVFFNNHEHFNAIVIFEDDVIAAVKAAPGIIERHISDFIFFICRGFGSYRIAGNSGEYFFSEPVAQGELLLNLHECINKQTRDINNDDNIPSILLAEDDEANRYIFTRIIERMGFKIDIAVNGLEAVNMFYQKKYNLVLMDCIMPEMSGIEALNKINQDNPENTPIIALTGMISEADILKYRKEGFSDILAKPVKLDDFSTIINKWAPKLYNSDFYREFNIVKFSIAMNSDITAMKNKIRYFLFIVNIFFLQKGDKIYIGDALLKLLNDLYAVRVKDELTNYFKSDYSIKVLPRVKTAFVKLEKELLFFIENQK